jgi:hypothetical protein
MVIHTMSDCVFVALTAWLFDESWGLIVVLERLMEDKA